MQRIAADNQIAADQAVVEDLIAGGIESAADLAIGARGNAETANKCVAGDDRPLVEYQRIGPDVEAAVHLPAHLHRLPGQHGAAAHGAVHDDRVAGGDQVAGDGAVDLDELGGDNQVVVNDLIGLDNDTVAGADVGGMGGRHKDPAEGQRTENKDEGQRDSKSHETYLHR